MRKVLGTALALLLLGTTTGHAEVDGLKDSYVSIGYIFGNAEFKQDGGKTDFYEPSFNLGLGTTLTATESDIGSLRVAVDWTYRGFEEDNNAGFKTDILINTFGANAYFDFKTGTALTPYVNGMLGITYAHLDFGPGFDKSKATLSYGVGLGAAVQINQKTDIDLGYKYGKMMNKVGGVKIENSDVILSLRLHF